MSCFNISSSSKFTVYSVALSANYSLIFSFTLSRFLSDLSFLLCGVLLQSGSLPLEHYHMYCCLFIIVFWYPLFELRRSVSHQPCFQEQETNNLLHGSPSVEKKSKCFPGNNILTWFCSDSCSIFLWPLWESFNLAHKPTTLNKCTSWEYALLVFLLETYITQNENASSRL